MRTAYPIAILLTQVVPLQAGTVTNAVPFAPLSAIAAARTPVRQPEFGRIATNTPAFEEYGFNLMLSQANLTREVWKLDIPKPIQVNEVLFSLKPTATGIDGSLGTRDRRYVWAFRNGSINLFRDEQCSSRAYSTSTNSYGALAKMAKTKSKITEGEAIKMARDCLHALGLTEGQLRLHEPPKVELSNFTDEDTAKKYKVPLFSVGWSVEGANPEARLLQITISGITTNIVEYFNADPNTPRFPTPTNYFEMLNLPANYLDTLPTKARSQLGLPATTNRP